MRPPFWKIRFIPCSPFRWCCDYRSDNRTHDSPRQQDNPDRTVHAHNPTQSPPGGGWGSVRNLSHLWTAPDHLKCDDVQKWAPNSLGYKNWSSLTKRPIAVAKINAKTKTKTAFPKCRLIVKPRSVREPGEKTTFKGLNLTNHERGVCLTLSGNRIKQYTENSHARIPTTQQTVNAATSIQPRTVRHSSIIDSQLDLPASIFSLIKVLLPNR